jgi:hypothetical protein
VQLRRFYVIDSARRPNLASQCLALSLRTLGGEFEARHDFQPLLAESFHDPDEHTGTLYKATNWLPLGFTKGFKRHRRAIGLTKRNKKTGLLTMPGYGALNDMVNRIDPVELARALNAWLTENSELLPKSLALDGKSIGAKGRLGGIV